MDRNGENHKALWVFGIAKFISRKERPCKAKLIKDLREPKCFARGLAFRNEMKSFLWKIVAKVVKLGKIGKVSHQIITPTRWKGARHA